ncbi:hypothetical protein ElyMa_000398300 [Elysia marginata]|uniref:Uncharacterized protein n=1 Tax=Elysia marginata TaxID=1093978 RepID=A0AAV4FIC2_9GAST|nr:hypothetical protein ElyMa_000398300 [Elysia marginata]
MLDHSLALDSRRIDDMRSSELLVVELGLGLPCKLDLYEQEISTAFEYRDKEGWRWIGHTLRTPRVHTKTQIIMDPPPPPGPQSQMEAKNDLEEGNRGRDGNCKREWKDHWKRWPRIRWYGRRRRFLGQIGFELYLLAKILEKKI